MNQCFIRPEGLTAVPVRLWAGIGSNVFLFCWGSAAVTEFVGAGRYRFRRTLPPVSLPCFPGCQPPHLSSSDLWPSFRLRREYLTWPSSFFFSSLLLTYTHSSSLPSCASPFLPLFPPLLSSLPTTYIRSFHLFTCPSPLLLPNTSSTPETSKQ